MKKIMAVFLIICMLSGNAMVFAESFEGETAMESGFVIYDGNKTADIIIGSEYAQDTVSRRNYTQISRAAGDLRQDIAMVTGAVDYYEVSTTFVYNEDVKNKRLSDADINKTPQLKNTGEGIVVGSINDSEIIKKYIEEGKLDEAKTIEGKWEAFVIKQIDSSLVIAGSDARGTIYGIYHLSEEIGVSPWYWFSDAPVKVKDRVVVDYNEAYINYGPDVKYRGIFINDEERLIDWAKLKFPTDNGTPDVNLYRHVFELMLRLGANTLWPAMHEGTTAFNMAKDEDGIPINAKEAGKYGIIMASSHAEMMLRCNVSEWSEFKENHRDEYTWNDNGSFDYTQNKEAILGYWKERLETNKDFESILSLGIRGVHDGDAETDRLYLYNNSKVEMMRDVIAEQRKLIKEIYGSETAVPQVFIPYKTVADIYNAGLKDYIPDDVMLMWAEDNYGNLRQTPTEKEKARSGGCGVYYHSSYWSWYSPKSYLWLNSTQIYYMVHQMVRAYDTGAQAYWTLNVGDIKPGDIVTELFLELAWDIDTKDSIDEFLIKHAMRDYNTDYETAEKIAAVAKDFYQLSGVKKAEFFGHVNSASYNDVYFSSDMLYPFSITSEGDEGMRLVNKCNEMVDILTDVYNSLDEGSRDVFYQQIYYHVLSYRDVAEEYVYLWKNNTAAEEGRYQSAEIYTLLSQAARERVRTRQEDFWAIKDNKWEKAINYDHPVSYYNMNEGVLLVRDSQYKTATASEGLGVKSESNTLRFDKNADNESYIDLFVKGTESESWSIDAPEWIKLSKNEGEVGVEERVVVGVDFSLIPNTTSGTITVYNGNVKTASIPVIATVNNITLEENSFIEANGKVVIETEHFTENIKGDDGTYWEVFENAGRWGDAMSSMPFDSSRADGDSIKNSARLRYRVYFTSMGTFMGFVDRIPTLNEGTNDDGSSRSCRTAIGIDNSTPYLLKGNSTTGGSWKSNIMHMIEQISFSVTVNEPGWHDIYIYKSDAGMLIDRITIETISGAAESSLMGAEESPNTFDYVAREVAALPEELNDIEILPSVTLEENTTEEITLSENYESVTVSDDRVCTAFVENNSVKITAHHSGKAALSLSSGEKIARLTVVVMPEENSFVEENGALVINAATAILNNEHASMTGSSNGVHIWELSGIGISATPMATADSRANWVATNQSDGARLLTAAPNQKVGSSEAYGSAPYLSYNVTITNAGTYKLYVNTSNPNANADSYHVYVDDVWKYHSSDGGSEIDDGYWYTYEPSEGFYLSKGKHTIKIAAREAGFTINTLALFKSGTISTDTFDYMSISSVTGKGRLYFTLVPGVKSDGIVGLAASDKTPSAWGDYPMTIRIRPEGHFDCYNNGQGFTYDSKITYKEGESYRICVTVDINKQTYSVDINNQRMATDYKFRVEAKDISRITVRGGADVSPRLFVTGGYTLLLGAYLSSAEIKDGKTYYTIVPDENEGVLYVALYREDTLLETKKNPSEEGFFDMVGDKVALFNWEDGNMKPISNKSIIVL
ncbi:MAG: glycosyl hydrolase 115 family protein [Clostridia bacterium]|nr:glycosyl hydrolase 115 family protein [Clostridia bacterium]